MSLDATMWGNNHQTTTASLSVWGLLIPVLIDAGGVYQPRSRPASGASSILCILSRKRVCTVQPRLNLPQRSDPSRQISVRAKTSAQLLILRGGETAVGFVVSLPRLITRIRALGSSSLPGAFVSTSLPGCATTSRVLCMHASGQLVTRGT